MSGYFGPATPDPSDAQHIMWRIRSDLRILRTHHGGLSSRDEDDYAHDLLAWVRAGYAATIEFAFIDIATATRRYAVRYGIRAEALPDTDAGGLRYVPLDGTSFRLVVHPSTPYQELPEPSQAAFLATLRRPWPFAIPIPDGQGEWHVDRSYGGKGMGASRNVFRSA
jgi:hypothetical protein